MAAAPRRYRIVLLSQFKHSMTIRGLWNPLWYFPELDPRRYRR